MGRVHHESPLAANGPIPPVRPSSGYVPSRGRLLLGQPKSTVQKQEIGFRIGLVPHSRSVWHCDILPPKVATTSRNYAIEFRAKPIKYTATGCLLYLSPGALRADKQWPRHLWWTVCPASTLDSTSCAIAWPGSRQSSMHLSSTGERESWRRRTNSSCRSQSYKVRASLPLRRHTCNIGTDLGAT